MNPTMARPPVRRRQRARHARPLSGGGEVTLFIDALGAQGDGLASHNGRRVFVPCSAPGDTVRARIEEDRGDGLAASLIEVISPSPSRVSPPCPHFGRCGGCALQHVEASAYAAWKRGLVVAALASRGLGAAKVAELVCIAPGTRRRAALRAVGTGGRAARLGFSERARHRLVDIEVCPILMPELVAALPSLKVALGAILAPSERIWVALTATPVGIDLLLTCDAEPALDDLEHLVRYAEASGLARVVWHSGPGGEQPVAIARQPYVEFSGIRVALPPGAFLQPSVEGETALSGLVRGVIRDAPRVADLYAGLGTFAVPLAAAGARLAAFEADRAAVLALGGAAHALGGRLAVARRDLAQRPLMPEELAAFDAVVLDPPRAGAAEQAGMLARSSVPRVAYVSCNPASFARDARVLVDGGYTLSCVTPVDQFPWSPHLELVGEFHRV